MVQADNWAGLMANVFTTVPEGKWAGLIAREFMTIPAAN
jgi:hypothetical protein